MSRSLDVLVIESHRGAGDAAARNLDAAGHRVHRCHDHDSSGFPCRGVIDPEACPLDHAADVALLVRRPGTFHPTPLEQGVSCAIRADVPVVQLGNGVASPFGDWLAARIDEDAESATAAEAAAEAALDTLRRTVLTMAGPLLIDLGIEPTGVTCDVVPEHDHLHVQLHLPVTADESVKQAVAVRALAALRGQRRNHRSIGVAVDCP